MTLTKEQSERIRYWDFVLYWMDFAMKRQKAMDNHAMGTPEGQGRVASRQHRDGGGEIEEAPTP